MNDPNSPPDPGAGEAAKLPEAYGRTRLVLMEVEPHLIHAYWEITPFDLKAANEQQGGAGSWILRFYETGEGTEAGEGTGRHFFDVSVNLDAGGWYIGFWDDAKSCYAEIGPRDPEQSSFLPICRSNTVHMPRAKPSSQSAPQWRRVEAKGERFEEAEPASPGQAGKPGAAIPEPSQNPIGPVSGETSGSEAGSSSPAVAANESSSLVTVTATESGSDLEGIVPGRGVSVPGPPQVPAGMPTSGGGGCAFPVGRFTVIERSWKP